MTDPTDRPVGTGSAARSLAAAGRADRAAVDAVAQAVRPVLLVDTAESLAPLEDWLRTSFLPALPADALVVIAGRTPPY